MTTDWTETHKEAENQTNTSCVRHNRSRFKVFPAESGQMMGGLQNVTHIGKELMENFSLLFLAAALRQVILSTPSKTQYHIIFFSSSPVGFSSAVREGDETGTSNK